MLRVHELNTKLNFELKKKTQYNDSTFEDKFKFVLKS